MDAEASTKNATQQNASLVKEAARLDILALQDHTALLMECPKHTAAIAPLFFRWTSQIRSENLHYEERVKTKAYHVWL